MKVELVAVSIQDKPVVQALMQLYVYDFSEMIELDVDGHGKFFYPYLDHYWTESGRYPFLLRCDGKIAGFALVRTLEFGDDPLYQLAEFFIMRRYRRRGLGREAARAVFDRFRGRWEVDQIAENTAATTFWRRVIGEYTSEHYVEIWRDENGDRGPAQFFSNQLPGDEPAPFSA